MVGPLTTSSSMPRSSFDHILATNEVVYNGDFYPGDYEHYQFQLFEQREQSLRFEVIYENNKVQISLESG